MSAEILSRIEDVLDQVRPALHSDGGDVELVDFDEEHEEGPVRVGRVEVLGHPAASCP